MENSACIHFDPKRVIKSLQEPQPKIIRFVVFLFPLCVFLYLVYLSIEFRECKCEYTYIYIQTSYQFYTHFSSHTGYDVNLKFLFVWYNVYRIEILFGLLRISSVAYNILPRWLHEVIEVFYHEWDRDDKHCFSP